MSQENVQIVANMYQAFEEGNISVVLSIMDLNIEWREADNFPYADRNPYIGPDAVVNGVFARLCVDWDMFACSPHTILDAGDTVVALGHYTGTSKATGKPIKAQFAHVMTMADGRVAKFQQYADTAQVRDALKG